MLFGDVFSLSQLRLLILGAGAVVREYYIPALRALNLIEQTTISDSSAIALRGIKGFCPNLEVQEGDFREILTGMGSRSVVDAVIVALPNCLHEEASALALHQGAHVLCEKPLALAEAACVELAGRAEATNRILAVGMVRRLLPSVCALNQALHQNLIGEVIDIDIEDGAPYAWPSDSGNPFRRENGGVLADMGIHYLDLVQYLIGNLVPLEYRDDFGGGVEANSEFHLRTESGIPVRLALSRVHKLRNTAIFRGQNGVLIIEKDHFDFCRWEPKSSAYVAKLSATHPFSNSNWTTTFTSCFAEQLLRFLRSIREERKYFVSAREAAAGVKLIEWAYEHRGQSRRHVKLNQQGDRPALPVAPIVVTGGTGFIGVNLVSRFKDLGFDQIKVPVRSYRTCATVASFPVDLRCVNLLNYHEVQDVIAGARYVFHLAYGRDGSQGTRVTIEGTRNVVEAAIAQHVESVVILSTIYVFGRPNSKRPVDETWPYRPVGGEYGKSKTIIEKWCLQRARFSHHTRIVLLNPSCVYGPFGGTYTKMPVQMAREGTFCWIEGGRGLANYVYVDNLIDAMLLAAQSQEGHGHRFIINDGTTTWHEFLKHLLGPYAEGLPSYAKKTLSELDKQNKRRALLDALRVIAFDRRVVNAVKNTFPFRVPLKLAARYAPDTLHKVRGISSSSVAEVSLSNGRHPPPLWLADLFPDIHTTFSAEKAHRLLNWTPRIDLERGQELTVKWLRNINLL